MLHFAEMMALLYLFSHPIDWWVKFAQIVQGLFTPVIAIIIGIISVKIQRQQSRIQKQQALTNRRQYRLAFFERRIKVFDSTLDFIALVGKEGKIEDFEPLFKLLRETREHKLLFGDEIAAFITELYKNGLKLRTTHSLHASGKQVDTVEEANIIEWFAEQTAVAEQKFLQYIDFRQPY